MAAKIFNAHRIDLLHNKKGKNPSILVRTICADVIAADQIENQPFTARLQTMLTPTLDQRLAESARYALLRRLTPVLRHNMAGALQPLSMMSMLIEKRLQNPSPDMAALAKNSSQLGALAREASAACLGLMTWLAPSSHDRLSVTAAIEDAVGLVRTEMTFKGFSLVDPIADIAADVPRSLTRGVFLAALLALTDAAQAPANVVLDVQLVDHNLQLTLSIQPSDGEVLMSGEPAYRPLDWDDVQALANTESVQLTHTSGQVELRCPLALA